jgi:hypothetical protein
VAQSYNVFRFLMACQSRGRVQTKFNGGLFTQPLLYKTTIQLGRGMHAIEQSDGTWFSHEDEREWGRRFTFQNQRLLYWPLLMSGDFDLMEPFFGYYWQLLPVWERRRSSNGRCSTAPTRTLSAASAGPGTRSTGPMPELQPKRKRGPSLVFAMLRSSAASRFTESRGPDSCPDFDHFGAGSTALQRMLVQEAAGKIFLLPAWPADWDVDFKLHLTGGAVIGGKVIDGSLAEWFRTGKKISVGLGLVARDANGVGSRFRATTNHMEDALPENDSRPLPQNATVISLPILIEPASRKQDVVVYGAGKLTRHTGQRLSSPYRRGSARRQPVSRRDRPRHHVPWSARSGIHPYPGSRRPRAETDR